MTKESKMADRVADAHIRQVKTFVPSNRIGKANVTIASGVIKIERKILKKIVDEFYKRLMIVGKGGNPNYYSGDMLLGETVEVSDVKGRNKIVMTALIFESDIAPGLFGDGGFGIAQNGMSVIKIETATWLLDPLKLKDMKISFKNELSRILAHELTHVKSFPKRQTYKRSPGRREREEEGFDMYEYHNDEGEVESLIQDVLSDLASFPGNVERLRKTMETRKDKSKFAVIVMKLSKMWRDRNKFLTSFNRRRIMKAVLGEIFGGELRTAFHGDNRR